MLGRVLKAKYFLYCDILDAVPKGNFSFTWKSLCYALELVRKGIRWRIGDGTNVDIWMDKYWIPRESFLKPFTPNLLGIDDTTVSILIDRDNMRWDEEVINSLFWEEDYKIILQIPLAVYSSTDIRVWNPTCNGFYSVRTTYYLARQMKAQIVAQGVGQKIVGW